MKYQKFRCCLFFFFLLLATLSNAQVIGDNNGANDAVKSAPAKAKPAKISRLVPPEKASPIRLTRFAAAPVIDGKMNDEVWQTAAVFKDFFQTQPGENIAPEQATEVRIGYDNTHLYFAFRAWDAAGKVRATVAKRDNIFDDDFIWVTLDTFNDR